MSLSDRRTLILGLPALLLAGCGFSPVYDSGTAASALRGQVGIAAPDTIDGYLLVRKLEERLGRGGAQPAYKMALTYTAVTQGQAITASNETTRYSIIGRVEYALTRVADGVVVASGEVDNFTGYSATGSTVETLAGERDARDRLTTILADQITTQVYATAEIPA